MGGPNGGACAMKKTTYVFFVIVPLFLYYLYTLKSKVDETTSDKNYYAFTILILACIIFINKELKERKKIKKEQIFLPIFISTVSLVLLSLFYILINKETNIRVILSDVLLISLGGLIYYLLKTMKP